MKVLIIIPAYNEQDNISSTIRDIQTHFPEADYLVVNDCSIDDTEAILQQEDANYISLPCNLGIGGGVQSGYLYAYQHDYDIAVQFDGDGQHDARYLRALIQPICTGVADYVVGSRFINKEGFQSTGLRRIGITFLSFLLKCLGRVDVRDVTSGMRAVNRRFIKEFAYHYAQDYPEPEALLAAALSHARICEIPVEMRERSNGSSSITPIRSLYYMIKVSLALFIVRISRKKGK